MPARRAPAPGAVPFHLPRLAGRRRAPDREINRVALAGHRVDPAFARIGVRARQPPIVGDGCGIEIKPAVELIAVPGLDRFRPVDHRLDIVGGAGMRGLANVQPRQIGFEVRLIEFGNVPGRFALCRGHSLHLVLARIGVAGQMADIGDVDDMGELVTLASEDAPQRVGKDIGAHIADMLIIIDRRAAAIDARLARVHRRERFKRTGQAVVKQ